MSAKESLLVLLIMIYLLILVAINYLFFNTYHDAYKTANKGQHALVTILDLAKKPTSGDRGYTYLVDWNGEQHKMYIKAKLALQTKVSVIISPVKQGRMFLWQEDSNSLSIFNGITGNAFLSMILVFIHLSILVASWRALIAWPLLWFKKGLKKRMETR